MLRNFQILALHILLLGASSVAALDTDRVIADVLVDSVPRKLQGCSTQQQAVAATVKLDDSRNENQVVFTEYGRVDFPSETLQVVEELSNFGRCFARNTLYGISLIDSGSNGLQSPGYFIFELNGRGVRAGGSFPRSKTEILVYGDQETCGASQARLSVDISFDDSPEDIQWVLTGNTEIALLSSTDTTVAGATKYTQVFADNRLFVDRCLSGGAYTFSISDSTGGSSISYVLLLNGIVIKAGNVPLEKESTIINVEGALSPTFAPTSRDTTPTTTPTFNPTEGDSLPPDDRPSTRPSQLPSFVPSSSPITPVPTTAAPTTTAPITPAPTLNPTPVPTTAPIQMVTPEPTAIPVVTPRPTLTPTLAAVTFAPTPNPTPLSPTPIPTPVPPTPNPTPSPVMAPSPIVITKPNASNGCANLGGACNMDFDCCSARCTANVCTSSIPAPTPTFPPVPTFSAAPLPFFRQDAGGAGAGSATMPQKQMMRMELPSKRRNLVSGKQGGTETGRSHRGID